jgi:hypothetical protein
VSTLPPSTEIIARMDKQLVKPALGAFVEGDRVKRRWPDGEVTDHGPVPGGGSYARPEALPAAGNGQAAEAPTSWAPIDLADALSGEGPKVEPTMLTRTDGVVLLYRHRLHWLSAEPESGKGWLALLACAERMDLGEHVLYIDCEDTEDGVVERLLALGVDPDVIFERFHYVRPDGPLTSRGMDSLEDTVVRYQTRLAIIDGVTEAMALHGWDPDKNADVAKWVKLLPRELADWGPAVLCLDHVVKSKDSRGRYAIGGQHKLAGLSGAAYVLDVVTPFARGCAGMARLIVTKDRPGQVRRHCAGAKRSFVGEFHLASDDGGTITEVAIRAPSVDNSDGDFRPTVLMERASRAAEAAPDGLSARALEAAFSGKATAKRIAIQRLVQEGYLSVLTYVPEGRARVHVSVRPFRKDADA